MKHKEKITHKKINNNNLTSYTPKKQTSQRTCISNDRDKLNKHGIFKQRQKGKQ